MGASSRVTWSLSCVLICCMYYLVQLWVIIHSVKSSILQLRGEKQPTHKSQNLDRCTHCTWRQMHALYFLSTWQLSDPHYHRQPLTGLQVPIVVNTPAHRLLVVRSRISQKPLSRGHRRVAQSKGHLIVGCPPHYSEGQNEYSSIALRNVPSFDIHALIFTR